MDKDTIHIINAFESATRGSERAALAAAVALRGLAQVRVWSTLPASAASRALEAEFGIVIEPVRPFAGCLPRGGRLVIWGTHHEPAYWLGSTAPHAVALVCEPFHAAVLYRSVLALRAAGLPAPAIVYISGLLRRAMVLEGTVRHPPLDLAPYLGLPPRRGDRVVIGRVSRDIPDKHHDEDPALYRELAASGIGVRLLGGTCLSGRAGIGAGIELLPEGAERVPAFLAGLDVFFYRTAGPGRYVEPFGLVVAEAMAAGLAVVAGGPGGFTELVEDGVTGLLVHSTDQARQALRALAADAALRRRLGDAAREKAKESFGAGYGERLLAALAGQDGVTGGPRGGAILRAPDLPPRREPAP